MDINEILNGLMNVTGWIETYLINGLLGQGFGFLKNIFGAYETYKPLIDAIMALFGAFGAA